MANDAKRTSQLGIATTLSANDRVVVLTNPDTSAQTQTIAVSDISVALANTIPIANSTQAGVIKIGPGLVSYANGTVTAPLPVATYATAGVVIVGTGLSVDSNGTLSTTGGAGQISGTYRGVWSAFASYYQYDIVSYNSVYYFWVPSGAGNSTNSPDTDLVNWNVFSAVGGGGGGGSVNADAQYVWSNTQTFTNTITFSSTINGTANNALYLGGIPASSYVNTNQITAYQTNVGLAGNVATLTSNSANFLQSHAPSYFTNYSDTAAASAAATAYANAAAYATSRSYVNTSQLSTDLAYYATTASVTANAAATYASAVQYVNNQQYANTAQLSGNAATTYANSVAYSNTIAATTYSNAVSYVTAQSYVNTAQLSANVATTYANGVAYSNSIAATAYANAIAYSYTNAVAYVASQSFVNTAQLSSNLSAYALTGSVTANAATAYANAIAYSGNAAQAYANAVTYVNSRTNVPGVNTYVLFNDNNTVNAVSTFYFSKSSSSLYVNGFIGTPALAYTNGSRNIYLSSGGQITTAGDVNVGNTVTTANVNVSNSIRFSDSTYQNTAFQKVAAPANSTSTGTTNQIAWDSNYIYICVSTNTWKRVALNLTSW